MNEIASSSITEKQFANAVVKFEGKSDSMQLQGTGLGTGHNLGWDWYQHYPQPIVERYFHSYPMVVQGLRQEDDYKKAFKIAKKLLKKKLLNSRKLVDFIELVEMIVEDM